MNNIGCGIDIGGSGIKAALVDLSTGELIGERIRIDTPEVSTPAAVADVCAELLTQLEVPAGVPIGIAMPAPLPGGIVPFMANLDPSWEGIHAGPMFSERLGHPVTVLNDADAAGLAEAVYGAARDSKGLTIVTTLGTGIGSAFIYNGVLIPNVELGHLEIDGRNAESHASAKQRVDQDLSWEEWTSRLQRYYSVVEQLFSPDLIVVGGGVSRNHAKFLPNLELRAPIVPAALRNRAGIVGAAVAARDAEAANN